MSPIREATVTIDGDSLNSVRSFVYLGSAINTGPPPPDNEINKIKKPTAGAERVSGSSPSARSIEWFASQRWSMLWNLHHNTVGIPSACQVCSAVICDTSCISRRKTPPPQYKRSCQSKHAKYGSSAGGSETAMNWAYMSFGRLSIAENDGELKCGKERRSGRWLRYKGWK